MSTAPRRLLPPCRRSDCPPRSEPCRRLFCRYHLWLDPVRNRRGDIVDYRETGAFGDTRHTCALRQAAHGPKTLEEIGSILDLSRERVRQIEEETLASLREGDPGCLRALLDAVNDTQADGEPWESHEDECLRCHSPSGEEGEEPTDDTGLPEGADDAEDDDTGSLPWSEPTSTDPRIVAVNQHRIDRATVLAAGARPFWCPHCGRSYPGITLLGTDRRGCPNPRCAARAWGDRARDQNRHRDGIAPEVVAAIVSEYRPGEHGYRTIAKEHGLPVPTVRSLIRRSNKEGR